MPIESFLRQLEDSGIIERADLEEILHSVVPAANAEVLASELIRLNKLTPYQADEIIKGRGSCLTLGNYVLLEKIGRGGMGTVYKARHQRMDRIVAIKVLPQQLTGQKGAVARFEREVRTVAKLEHPNIVCAHDADCANGVYFFVMPFIEGCNLSVLVRTNGPCSVAHSVDYVLQAARGLEFAHREGVIHRDIKPANLLLDARGVIRILDLGLARISDDQGGPRKPALTTPGAVMGTADYMAPEQARDAHAATPAADVYALGCTLHYLLTGRAVYGGDTLMAKILAHRDNPIPSLRSARPDVPEPLDSLFKWMVAKTVADRCQSMTEVICGIEQCRMPLTPIGGSTRADGTTADSAPSRHRPDTSSPDADSTIVSDHFHAGRNSLEPGT